MESASHYYLAKNKYFHKSMIKTTIFMLFIMILVAFIQITSFFEGIYNSIQPKISELLQQEAAQRGYPPPLTILFDVCLKVLQTHD
jgi:hypothetical protein